MALSIPKPYIYLGAAAAGIGLFFLSRKASAASGGSFGGSSGGWDIDEAPADGPKAQPIYVDKRGDPTLEAYLTEMDNYFKSRGVNTNWIDAAEVTVMRKAPGKPHAIPPREFWPRMARTITELFMPVREYFGGPLVILNGYRPEDYNKAVTCTKEDQNGNCIEWTKGSRHQWFDALDIMVPVGSSTSAKRKELALLGAQMYLQKGDELGVGFGAYDPEAPQPPGNIHLDASDKKRTWANADYWVEQAAAMA